MAFLLLLRLQCHFEVANAEVLLQSLGRLLDKLITSDAILVAKGGLVAVVAEGELNLLLGLVQALSEIWGRTDVVDIVRLGSTCLRNRLVAAMSFLRAIGQRLFGNLLQRWRHSCRHLIR